MKTKISRMVGQLTIPFLFLLIHAVISIGAVQASPSISIVPPSTTANQGDTFSVNVTADPAGNQVKGVEINLKFDQNSVQLNSVVIGNFLGSSPLQFQNQIDNTYGTLKLAHTVAGGDPAVTSPGTYATLNFKVNSNAPAGTSALNLTRAILSDDTGANIPEVTANNGTITVTSATPTSTPTPATSSGGSGGGGGGGGGGGSDEKFSNIEVGVGGTFDEAIAKDRVVTSYRSANKSNPIMFVNITGNVNTELITTKVEVLKNTSTLVKSPPPHTVYKNINIWVGTSGFATPKNIKEALIRFKLENSWLNSNNLRGSDVKMYRWNNDSSEWVQLETSEKENDSANSYFEAMTNSFSPFAIVGVKVQGGPVAGESPGMTETLTKPAETNRATATNIPRGTPGFEVVTAIAALCAIYIFCRKMRI